MSQDIYYRITVYCGGQDFYYYTQWLSSSYEGVQIWNLYIETFDFIELT